MVHELATNAARHGALAAPHGRVAMRWDRQADGGLALSWQEAGGVAVQAPLRQGFGATFIAEPVPHDLGGEASVSSAADGLRARGW